MHIFDTNSGVDINQRSLPKIYRGIKNVRPLSILETDDIENGVENGVRDNAANDLKYDKEDGVRDNAANDFKYDKDDVRDNAEDGAKNDTKDDVKENNGKGMTIKYRSMHVYEQIC